MHKLLSESLVSRNEAREQKVDPWPGSREHSVGLYKCDKLQACHSGQSSRTNKYYYLFTKSLFYFDVKYDGGIILKNILLQV